MFDRFAFLKSKDEVRVIPAFKKKSLFRPSERQTGTHVQTNFTSSSPKTPSVWLAKLDYNIGIVQHAAIP